MSSGRTGQGHHMLASLNLISATMPSFKGGLLQPPCCPQGSRCVWCVLQGNTQTELCTCMYVCRSTANLICSDRFHTEVRLQVAITILYNSHKHTHVCTYVYAHTTLTLQHSLHLFTKLFHPWVTSHSNDHITHYHRSIPGALLPQAIMEDLILLGSIMPMADFPFITICNNFLVLKLKYNVIGIHISDELVPEVVKNVFCCTERSELLHTNLPTSNAHCRATLHPL